MGPKPIYEEKMRVPPPPPDSHNLVRGEAKLLASSPTRSDLQTVWIQIRPDVLSGLMSVQTVCKGYQQTTLVGKELRDDFTKTS